MNNEKLNHLFNEIREEKIETSLQDANNWITLSAASAGVFGLLSKFKLSFLLTKKIIIMSSFAFAIGITCTGIFLYSQSGKEIKQTPLVAKTESRESIKPIFSIAKPTKITPEISQTLNLPIGQTTLPETAPNEIARLPLYQLSAFSSDNVVHPSNVSSKVNEVILENEDRIIIEERNVTRFYKLSVSHAFDIYLSQGEKHNVRLEIDERYIHLVETHVVNNELVVKCKKGSDINNAKKLAVYITITSLNAMNISGAVDLNASMPLTFDDLKLTISGATDIEMDLTANELIMDVSGASNLKLKGKVSKLKADLSGASDIKMGNCNIKDAVIDISGVVDAKMNVTGDLKIDASGASNFNNKGRATNNDINVSGAAKVKK